MYIAKQNTLKNHFADPTVAGFMLQRGGRNSWQQGFTLGKDKSLLGATGHPRQWSVRIWCPEPPKLGQQFSLRITASQGQILAGIFSQSDHRTRKVI